MAAVDYFLKLKGIEGESAVDGHKNEIQIDSFSFGVSNSGSGHTGGGHGTGKATFQDLHCTTKYGKQSAKLFLTCATGEHIPDGLITARKAGGKQEVYLTIKLTDILVSSYQVGGSGHGDSVPTDQFSLNFAKMQIEYKGQDQKGGTSLAASAGYDIKANKKI